MVTTLKFDLNEQEYIYSLSLVDYASVLKFEKFTKNYTNDDLKMILIKMLGLTTKTFTEVANGNPNNITTTLDSIDLLSDLNLDEFKKRFLFNRLNSNVEAIVGLLKFKDPEVKKFSEQIVLVEC